MTIFVLFLLNSYVVPFMCYHLGCHHIWFLFCVLISFIVLFFISGAFHLSSSSLHVFISGLHSMPSFLFFSSVIIWGCVILSGLFYRTLSLARFICDHLLCLGYVFVLCLFIPSVFYMLISVVYFMCDCLWFVSCVIFYGSFVV